jgi:hypothetical protein
MISQGPLGAASSGSAAKQTIMRAAKNLFTVNLLSM